MKTSMMFLLQLLQSLEICLLALYLSVFPCSNYHPRNQRKNALGESCYMLLRMQGCYAFSESKRPVYRHFGICSM